MAAAVRSVEFRWIPWALVLLLGRPGVAAEPTGVVPVETRPLTGDGDFASLMVDGIDRFLLRRIAETAAGREAAWSLDLSSAAACDASLRPHREYLARCLGVRDARLPFAGPDFLEDGTGHSVLAASRDVEISAIRWPVLGDPSPQCAGLPSVYGEGLLIVPRGRPPTADVIVIPDADQTPEQLCGLTSGIEPGEQTARLIAAAGCRVVVPRLISRQREQRAGRATLTHREYVHRAAFILGRTLVGYEVQSILSLVDWFSADASARPLGVYGYGEGGMAGLFSAGLDPRIDAVVVSGFFGPRENSWNEPLERNLAGLLQRFGATELALLLAQRTLIVATTPGPELTLTGEGGGAPGQLVSPDRVAAAALLNEARRRLKPLADATGRAEAFHLAETTPAAVEQLLSSLRVSTTVAPWQPPEPTEGRSLPDPEQRVKVLVQEMDRHNQALLRESAFVREAFLSQLDRTSVAAFQKSAEPYRTIFRDQVIGKFDDPLLPPNAHSRPTWETDKWTGHEVQLDVYPDVMAYGVLLLPKDLKPGEQRPVVVCQHGLEGRPTDVFLNDNPAYHDFAAKLCERGFITFSPQNPYIFRDRFRTLQRKAQPLGRSLFSIIVPQHQQIVNWLKTQPFVDQERIAFYGLSYGGKSAMRIPALVTDYCLSICSADFNEWVLKNASSRHAFSYIGTGEYEIFEWDLGSTFNYAEMAALICPRPFMVERGHFDGVGTDDWVALEYAKVRHLYAARLGIGDRTEIEWFVGPHTINGKGTYAFLHRHLNWPDPTASR